MSLVSIGREGWLIASCNMFMPPHFYVLGYGGADAPYDMDCVLS